MEQTYKNTAVECCSAIERNRSRKSQISNRRLSKRNAQILRDIRVVLCRMSSDRSTACLDRLSYSPIGCPLPDISGKDTRCRRKGKNYEEPHRRVLAKHVQYNRNEREAATKRKCTYTCTPPRVQCAVPIPNDFPIGLRRNLSLISNGGPNIKELGKSGLRSCVSSAGHHSLCA